ncbi:MAG TPA: hypothetical protein VFV38_27140 [Ktedonobacteraceae bacterium]|nr:hypothetical protein [Ktedonobacteraceae bacterium]
MRQRIVTKHTTQRFRLVRQVHRGLIIDLSMGGLLALLELGLLAFLLYLGLLDPLKSLRPHWDNLYYEAMARSPFSSDVLVHTGPFCWRVLTPWLVHVLTIFGLSIQSGFFLISILSLYGAIIGTYILLRLCGATPWQAVAIALLVQTQYALGFLGLWDYALTDPLSDLLLVLAFIFYWRDQPRWLLVVLALGALNRETALFVVAAFAGEQIIRRDWRHLKAYLPTYIIPILIVIVLHLAIYQVNQYSPLSEIQTAWSQRSSLVGRGSTLKLFGNVNPYLLNLYHLTINSFGLLLPLLLLQIIHPPQVVRRPVVWIFLAVTVLSSSVLAGDNERLMIIVFPVVAVAAWYELCWFAQRIRLPAATIGFFLVAVQTIFLIGQFYKAAQDFSRVAATSLLEPHWLSILWLGSLFVLAGVALGAGLWVLGFFVYSLRRHRVLQMIFTALLVAVIFVILVPMVFHADQPHTNPVVAEATPSPGMVPTDSSAKTPTSTTPPFGGLLPGQQIWHGISSYIFGTNDTEEWTTNNFQTNLSIQAYLKQGRFPLMRTFFFHNSIKDAHENTDQDIRQRINAITNSDMQCLGVIPDIKIQSAPATGNVYTDLQFAKHLVSLLDGTHPGYQACDMYEIGNEPDATPDANNYVAEWNAFVPALRALNPRAKFFGPASYTDNLAYIQWFLQGAQASGVLPDGVTFHHYGCPGPEDKDECMIAAQNYGAVIDGVRNVVVSTLGKNLPIGLTEWNYDPNGNSWQMANDINFMTHFTTTVINQMIAAHLEFANQFDVMSYSGNGQLDMFDIFDGGPSTGSKPRVQYYTMVNLINHYHP